MRVKTLKYYIDTKEEHACVNSIHFHEKESISLPCNCVQPILYQTHYAFKHWQEEVKKGVLFYLPEPAIELLASKFHTNDRNKTPKIAHGTINARTLLEDRYTIGYEMDRLMFFFYEREHVHDMLVQLNDRENWNGRDWVYIEFTTNKEDGDIIQNICLHDYTCSPPTESGFDVRYGRDEILKTFLSVFNPDELPLIGLELWNGSSISHGRPSRDWDVLGKDMAILINRACTTFLRHTEHAAKSWSYIERVRKWIHTICDITETENNKDYRVVFY